MLRGALTTSGAGEAALLHPLGPWCYVYVYCRLSYTPPQLASSSLSFIFATASPMGLRSRLPNLLCLCSSATECKLCWPSF